MANWLEPRMVDRASGSEVPVWQPPRPPEDLAAADPEAAWAAVAPDDAALEAVPGESVGDRTNVAGVGWAADPPTPARRANSAAPLLVVSALVAICGVGFAAGRVTAQGQRGAGRPGLGGAIAAIQSTVPGTAPRATAPPILGLGGAGGSVPGSGTTVVSGTVTGVTSNSITIQQTNGRTVTIALRPSTAYATQTTATAADVIPGANVVVQTLSSGGRERGSEGFGDSNRGAVTRIATSVTITSK